MKTMLLTFIASMLLVNVSAQEVTSISNNDLQYIKSFFAANFIKTPVTEAGKTRSERFDYEITPEAIIVYKTELGATANGDHWYYLPLGSIRIQNYGPNLNYFQEAHSIWLEHKKGTLPHGLAKKFTKISDATYNSGWLNIPFKYNSYRDLDRLRDILDPPVQTNKTTPTRPATANKEIYNFNASILRDLFEIASQLNDNNMEAVMKAADYTLERATSQSSPLYKYDHETKRGLYLIYEHDNTTSLHILKAPFLGIELDDIMEDLEANGIEYAGTETDEESDQYYFTKEGSEYTFGLEEQKVGPFKYIYLYKLIEKIKNTPATEIDMFSGINFSHLESIFENNNSFTLKGKKYSTQKKSEVASFLNTQMETAYISADKNRLSFVTLGKIDFANRAIAFMEKDDALYIKINLPLNGTCDYGLKEIRVPKAIVSEPQSKGTDNGYYVSFAYDYSCAGIQYKYITVYIADTEMESYALIKRYLEEGTD
jgi:hypothetical protein